MLGRETVPDGGCAPGAVVSIKASVIKTTAHSPCARQHNNLGLLDSFGNEVFDDLADD